MLHVNLIQLSNSKLSNSALASFPSSSLCWGEPGNEANSKYLRWVGCCIAFCQVLSVQKTASSDVPPDIPGNGISCSAGVCALCAAKWLLAASSSIG